MQALVGHESCGRGRPLAVGLSRKVGCADQAAAAEASDAFDRVISEMARQEKKSSDRNE